MTAMNRRPHRLFALLALLVPIACSKDEPAPPNPDPAGSGSALPSAASDHGARLPLGAIALGGKSFAVTRLGEIAAGKEAAFEIAGVPAAELAGLNLYVWLEDAQGNVVAAPAKGAPEADHLHVHVMPRSDAAAPVRVVLRLRSGPLDERGALPLDGHGHEHVHGPHDGVPASFSGGAQRGWAELKLHDDKGDLELWLASDQRFTSPFDLPLDAVIELEFVDHGGRKVQLRARDAVNNPDEDGKPNVREGRTNYFIFPGATGVDASWLVGKTFQSIVVLRFARDGVACSSEEFVLTPHSH